MYLCYFWDSGVNCDVDVWLDDAGHSRHWRSDLHEAVWWALKDKGTAIAYPQMGVHLDEGLVEAISTRA